MKKILTAIDFIRIAMIFTIICFAIAVHAQSVAINTDGTTANTSAMLDVKSSDKGMLTPRMTTVQRTAIVAPANGLFVYDTDTQSFWYYSGAGWVNIAAGGGGGFTLPYSGSYNDLNKVFSITNTGSSNSRVAIYGKGSNVFTGLIPSNPTGVWGEEDGGTGVMGTSTFGNGVYGYSQNNAGIYGRSISQSGIGGKFENTANGYGLYATSTNGAAARFEKLNTTNTATVISSTNAGLGSVLFTQIDNPSNNVSIISASSNGTGSGLSLGLNNENSTGHAINVHTNGSGNGVQAYSKMGYAAFFYINNVSNNNTALYSSTSGTGSAASFAIINSSNSSPALALSTNGTGPAVSANVTNQNPINSIASFKRNGFNMARIDGTGKGFFNGGTQVGGADMAEVFDVEDAIENYEAGDVLVISMEKDRSVVKSSQPYSTLVAGVYATKPGVLMTEEDIETDLSGKVPMGVLGVIPTKVCLEGGEIKRGDLLVTSSTPGIAMKGDLDKVKPGQVIGKALENFNSSETGKIKVLVNVK